MLRTEGKHPLTRVEKTAAQGTTRSRPDLLAGPSPEKTQVFSLRETWPQMFVLQADGGVNRRPVARGLFSNILGSVVESVVKSVVKSVQVIKRPKLVGPVAFSFTRP
ncbi:hypothetical protein RRG08_064978 [Elysia crispata]|uniref:Uncharacterized protein n=1 Tax=Elysia crispata TaxID=231223 RepID=A0AAE0YAJ3_9GAST|nr:hypothetical protein RRG08_064978 [Elysia crispata]